MAEIELARIEQQLSSYLRQAVRAAFDWRRHNCHVFAADWVRQVRGIDPGADFRDRCSTPRGALRLIRRAGFADLAHLTAARMRSAGIAEIAPSAADIGDVGLVMAIGLANRPQQTLAILARSGWASPAPRGLMIAQGRAFRAWRIVETEGAPCPRP